MPAGTLDTLNMLAKSISEAKSNVTAVPLGRSETELEPDCGANVRPVMVTLKEITLHEGVSPPKTAMVPGAGTRCDVPPVPGPLHPASTSIAPAATSATARMCFLIAVCLNGVYVTELPVPFPG